MANLATRELGRTGLQVTTLGYGAMGLRGAPRGREVSNQQADSILNAVLDSGINYIDTSIDYGDSEEHIGRAISHRRSDYYLATKCGCVVGGPPERGSQLPHVFTRENIVAGVNQSLARMKTDYIDVLQFHSGPSREELEENGAIETVLDLKREGKVRFIGISSTLPHLADHIAMGVFDVFQIPYSALQREHEEVITAAAQAGVGTVIRGGVAKGAPSRGKQEGSAQGPGQQAELEDLLEGMTPMEFILRFTLTHPDLHTTIVGTISPDHLRENLDALQKGPLSSDLYQEARRRLTEMDRGA